MAPTFNSYVDFVEKMVLPCRLAHPEWRRMNGRGTGGDRTKIAYLNYKARLFCVHADAEIVSLLEPYAAMKRGVPDPILVICKTRNGKREKLSPAPGAGSDKGFYVYQHP